MPQRPLIVAEGPHLLPSLVAPHLDSPAHGIWLVPTAEFQRAALAERVGSSAVTSDPARARAKTVERNLLISAEIRAQAERLGLRVIDIDALVDLPRATALVEEHFAGVLARGPRAESPEERRRIRRAENEAAVRQICAYLRSDEAPPQDEEPRFPFACECTRPGCTKRVEFPIFELESLLESNPRFRLSAHA